jgi:hypothetical protein
MTPVEFYDEIYDYYTPPFWQTTWFYVVCGGIILFLIGLGIYFFLRRRRKTLMAWEWAHVELKRIAPGGGACKEDFKKFYFELTAIIKMYLYRRYGWQVLDKTDTEMILFLEQQKFDTSIIEVLTNVAEGALWVKFADMDVLKSQAEADWKSIVAMVERTTPVT